jgi:hypothetical protein
VRFLALIKLMDDALVFEKGLNLPIRSMVELEAEYKTSILRVETHSLDFNAWLPSMGAVVRPMVGGELLTILAATGVGKTALGQNIAVMAKPLNTLFFQQELPGSLTFERFAALATKTDAKDIYREYKSGKAVDWQGTGKLNHVYTVTKSRLTAEEIEQLILKSELKIGEKPALVVVDYIQLMGGKGERYERVSDAAEGLKVVAKNTNSIIVMLSQVGRKKTGSDNTVSLNDGKESGAIENSSGVVVGAWREDNGTLVLKILKNTKGVAGKEIRCNFDGGRMLISEQAEEPPEPDRTRKKASSPYADD